MPIKIGSTGIGAIYKGSTPIIKIYKGTDLLFQKVEEEANLLKLLIEGTIEKVTADDLGSIATIGEYSFEECSLLEEISLPTTVTTIGTYAFYGCTNLSKIELNEGLTTIGTYAFYGCENIKDITFPSTLTSIGTYAFSSSDGKSSFQIDTLTCLAVTPPTIESNASYSLPSATKIYVPIDSLSAYQSATKWSVYANRMEGI